MRSAGMRSATASATAVFPLAVGPKIPMTTGLLPFVMPGAAADLPPLSAYRRRTPRWCAACAGGRGRLGRDARNLCPAQRRRRRPVYPHPDELTGTCRAREVDGRVPPRASAQQRRIGATRTLDEHLFDPSHSLLVPFVRDALDDVDQALDTFSLDVLRYLIRKLGGLRTSPRREDEGKGPVVADLLDCVDRLPEILLRLAGEADDQVGRERQIRDRRAHP